MEGSTIPASGTSEARPLRAGLRRVAPIQPKLIDTRLVRAELARLRAPRPGTEVPRAAVVRSTLPGA